MSINQAAYPNDKNALGVTYETAALIGKRLRQAREIKRLSPSQVSARVKIRDRYIEAIEIGDWDVLPPGLNGRGLIRLYARELNVAIPEFEAFHHLQTVMVERQSESLMQSSSKKSKYHPAAEESAEIIRSISRSDFQKGISLDNDYQPSHQTIPTEENHAATKVYTRNQNNYANNRAAHASHGGIVTPNIYDVLGIQVDEKSAPVQQQASSKNAETNSKVSFQTLPTAEPVKLEHIIPKKEEKFVAEEPQMEFKTIPQVQSAEAVISHDMPLSTAQEAPQKEKIKKNFLDLNPIQILAILSFIMIFIFLSLFLYSRNTSQVKVTNLSAKQIESEVGDSEPLPSSVVNSNIPQAQENQKTAEVPPQTKTVAGDEKVNALSTSQTTSTSAIEKNKTPVEIERVAKLNIAAKVNLVIEADGQQVFSGVHSAGVLDIPFKNRAEIVITDSSKVSLIYEGINHGIMGHAGRKRKIILNAKPYIE